MPMSAAEKKKNETVSNVNVCILFGKRVDREKKNVAKTEKKCNYYREDNWWKTSTNARHQESVSTKHLKVR